MSANPRVAIHVAPPPIGEQLKACVRRAKSLGCRIVAITDGQGAFHNPDPSVLDRLAAGEFDVVILRAGVSVEAVQPASEKAPAKP